MPEPTAGTSSSSSSSSSASGAGAGGAGAGGASASASGAGASGASASAADAASSSGAGAGASVPSQPGDGSRRNKQERREEVRNNTLHITHGITIPYPTSSYPSVNACRMTRRLRPSSHSTRRSCELLQKPCESKKKRQLVPGQNWNGFKKTLICPPPLAIHSNNHRYLSSRNHHLHRPETVPG